MNLAKNIKKTNDKLPKEDFFIHFNQNKKQELKFRTVQQWGIKTRKFFVKNYFTKFAH